MDGKIPHAYIRRFDLKAVKKLELRRVWIKFLTDFKFIPKHLQNLIFEVFRYPPD